MRAALLVVCLALIAPACGPKKAPASLVDGEGLVEQVRARPVPDSLKARFQIRLKSKPLDLSGTTSGGIKVARPGRGQILIFGPIGGVLATLVSDGHAVAATLTKDRVHYLANDGEALLREATGGAAGVDDLMAILIGDLPFDDAPIREVRAAEAGVMVVLEGPDGIVVQALLDPVDKTPITLTARDKQQSLLIEARYDGWILLDGQRLPERVEVDVPAIDLAIAVRYQGWSRMDETPALDVTTPEGYAEASLEEAVRQGVQRIAPP